MKKLIGPFILLTGMAFFNPVAAQPDQDKQDKKDKKTEEIVIRLKDDKEKDLNIEIKADKILINGKPLAEFKDDGVTIHTRKMIIKDGKGNMAFDFGEGDAPFTIDKNFMKDFGEDRMVSRPFLGVTTEKVDDGAKITDITDGSAAQKAGLQEGDIITKIDDKDVDGPSSLSEIITSYKPKDKIKIYYTRDGKEKNTKATLGETKNSMSFAFRSPEGKVHSFTFPKVPGAPPTPPMPPGEIWNDQEFKDLQSGRNQLETIRNMFPRHQKLGLKIQDIEEGKGIKVLGTDKDSPAEKAGLQKDDIITEIAGNKVDNTDDAREQLQENQDKSSYTIKAKRNGTEMNFEVKIPKKLKTADL